MNQLKLWIGELDRLLRGEKTRPDSLREATLDVDLRGLIVMVVLLGMLYGVCMGTFALLRESGPVFEQMFATMLKVPALFLLTLVVTFPSLYVFNALVGSRLMIVNLLKLLMASLGVTMAMLAALGPIVAFFSLSTDNYSFMVLLNVLVFALSGSLGLMFLLQTLHRLTITQVPLAELIADRSRSAEETASGEVAAEGGASDSADEAIDAPAPESPPAWQRTSGEGPLDRLEGHVLGPHVKVVFRCWVVVFGLVGAQMSWVLRPFIGSPSEEFTWFRERSSNFFEATFGALRNLF